MNKKVLLILLILLFFILGSLVIVFYSRIGSPSYKVSPPIQEEKEVSAPQQKDFDWDRMENQEVSGEQIPAGYRTMTAYFEDKVKDYLGDCKQVTYMLNPDMTDAELGERSAELYKELSDLSNIDTKSEGVDFYMSFMEKVSDNVYCVFGTYQIDGANTVHYINTEGNLVVKEL